MRILFYCCGSENLGVSALMSYMKERGHSCELLFDPQLGNNFYLNLPFLNSLINPSLLIRKAKKYNPDLIAVSFLTNQYLAVRKFMLDLKKEINIPVIAGGFHATSLPEELIKEEWVDMICIGEGEEALAELAEKMTTHKSIDDIRNLWIKKESGIVIKNPVRSLIKNLDSLPFPDKEAFNTYGVLSKRILVMTSRGCPYACSYCINSFRNKIYEHEKFLRRRSVESVIEELLIYKTKYKPRFFQFFDDVFSYDKEWLSLFSELYPLHINIPFECYVTPNTVKKSNIALLKKSGCKSVIMGVQSGCADVRTKLLNRHYSNEQVIEAAHIIKSYNIKLITEYIFGFPGDNYDKMIKAYELTDKIKADFTGSFIFYPFPRTRLTDYCIENIFLTPENYKKVKIGLSSMHQLDSFIENQDKQLIYKFYAILPLYNKVNQSLKRLLIKQLSKKFSFTHKLINILSIPLLDWSYVINRIIAIPETIIKTRKHLKSK
ncbi:MAG: radical SAM protein [Bacteroidales bacterium]|nr:radical SAM protein [Bacteroidales bacterium]